MVKVYTPLLYPTLPPPSPLPLLPQNVFDELGEREIQRARLRSNPFETIGKVFFQNRAALKMANLDAITDMMFTKPVDELGVRRGVGRDTFPAMNVLVIIF